MSLLEPPRRARSKGCGACRSSRCAERLRLCPEVHRASTIALIFFLGLGTTLACGGPSDGSAPVPSVVLGTGEARFEPIEGEPELPLVAGVQGGSHIWASFLAYDFEGLDVDLVLSTSLDDVEDSTMVMRNPLILRETTDDQGEPATTFAGYPAQVFNPRCAHGKRVRIEVTLTDAEGRQASDVRHCIAQVPESMRSEGCGS